MIHVLMSFYDKLCHALLIRIISYDIVSRYFSQYVSLIYDTILYVYTIPILYRVKELMMRVRKVVESLPTQSDFELFTEEEERVSFEDEMTEKFEVFTDDNFPGQFRVVGDKIEKVTNDTIVYLFFINVLNID